MYDDILPKKVWPLIRQYYQHAESLRSEDNFLQWWKSLEESRRIELTKISSHPLRNNQSYLRFIMQTKNNSLEDYLKERLDDKDYLYWKKSLVADEYTNDVA